MTCQENNMLTNDKVKLEWLLTTLQNHIDRESLYLSALVYLANSSGDGNEQADFLGIILTDLRGRLDRLSHELQGIKRLLSKGEGYES
jgi:hypothetical protein